MSRVWAFALLVGFAGASCAELLGIESATVEDASLDAAVDNASEGLHCGNMWCSGSRPVCCFPGNLVIDGSINPGTCVGVDANATSQGDMCAAALHCDDQAECADGGVCCLTTTVDGSVSECSPSCSGSIMCDPTVDSGCACTGSVMFKGVSYSICE